MESTNEPTDTSPPEEISGFLYKRRGGFGKHMPNCWQSRFFLLRDGIISYYDHEEEDNKPRGRIDLRSGGFSFLIGVPIGKDIDIKYLSTRH